MNIKRNLVRVGLPLLGLVLAASAWRIISDGRPPTDTTPPSLTPAQAPPGASVVAGSGVVEPSSELIAVSNAVPGVVDTVQVSPGQTVQKGQPLYLLDSTELRAEVATRRALLASAVQGIEVARIELEERETSLALYKGVPDQRAVTQEEMNRREFAERTARARLVQARAAVAEAQAAVDETQARLGLRTVRAPIAGTVLQVKARPGQFAPAGALDEPLITLGRVVPLHVRVDVDEADMARLGNITTASISARGSQAPATTAALVRVEPLVVPKRSLTNAVTERVDTRVLQVVFALPQGAEGFTVGQQVEAFIEAGVAQ